MAPSLELSPTDRRAFDALADDLARVLGERFVALVAYAPGRGAAFTSSIHAADLDALATLADTWHRAGLQTPLLLTADEFRRSLDAFPIEYQAIIDRHVVIRGTPPFAGASVHAEALRRECETQAKGHLIHLRQGWIDAGGHAHDLADRLAASALPLRTLLTETARLAGESTADLPGFAARSAGVQGDIIATVLALEEHPKAAKQAVRRLPEYLEACEKIWAFVDGWQSR
jgi:hypothetical protein